MSSALVSVGSRSYRVTPDLPGRNIAFFIGAVSDDADGREMAREVIVSSDDRLTFTARSQREFAIVGTPGSAFADPAIAHSLTLTLRAAGYRDLVQPLTLPAFPNLPERRDLAMRRLPVSFSGRVFGRSGGPPPSHDPVPGATISLSPIPASGGELPLLLRQPLRADPGAAATIRRRGITLQAPLDAIADAPAGEQFVEVADGSAVGTGDLIRVGTDDRRFYGEIAEVLPHPDRPAPAALLRLTERLAGSIANGTSLERLTTGALSGATGSFIGAAFAGESVIWLDALPTTATGVLVIREAGQPDRYHDANARTNPTGDYRVTGFARIATPEFTVSAVGFTSKSASFPTARIGAGLLDWYLAP